MPKKAELDMLEEQLSLLRDVATPEQSVTLDLIKEEIDVLRERAESDESETKHSGSSRDGKSASSAPGDSRLKIQAIVWSNTPEDRLVMINDKIVQTGESIDDITVTYIGNDYIVVKEGEKEWEVKFK